jgi:hypothetical protein
VAGNQPSISAERTSAAGGSGERCGRLRALLPGGPEGNEQLTALTGAILIVALAVLGLTIVRIGQLIWLHLFLGLLLIGPVALKMASTGYRFALYYLKDPIYRRKGPPETWLRIIAPTVVFTTVGVFATGVPLIFISPAHREPLAEIHKVFFIVWLVFTGLHVLGHLPAMPSQLRGSDRSRVPGLDDSGRLARGLALATAIVGGLVLAIVLIPHFEAWTSSTSAFHHHHH